MRLLFLLVALIPFWGQAQTKSISLEDLYKKGTFRGEFINARFDTTQKESTVKLDQLKDQFGNTYDFLYLPCDFKVKFTLTQNNCNVGYGFINFINTTYLRDFYLEFAIPINFTLRSLLLNSQEICEFLLSVTMVPSSKVSVLISLELEFRTPAVRIVFVF